MQFNTKDGVIIPKATKPDIKRLQRILEDLTILSQCKTTVQTLAVDAHTLIVKIMAELQHHTSSKYLPGQRSLLDEEPPAETSGETD